ncbi:TonB-dependent receptor [Myxococcota bacterium]|nr:TonB-dependent receptor [Myxococcota bacterium]MBU1429627.1 TonB-dependent receptor [Myxococcota bacterium]
MLTLFLLIGLSSPTSQATSAPIIVYGERDEEARLEGRATQQVSRREMAERQSLSTPDALRYTSGVYVQQTAHSQGSAYIRGRTGRHTLLLFDGLRLNHALFRQGPNQYLFTVDARTLQRLEIVRGSASVELGANAISGAVLVHPRDPAIDPTQGFSLKPHLMARYGTPDRERGGRLELDAQLGPRTGVLLGVGGRVVGQLEASGPIEGLRSNPYAVDEKAVPRFEDNGRIQMGTGFDELTADARLVHLVEGGAVTLAAYAYRQYDAPRTDQCPPPETPDAWCLYYDEQFRTHIYSKASFTPKARLIHTIEGAVSFQRQHERRINDREAFINSGEDDIDVWSARVSAEGRPIKLAEGLTLRTPYGIDASFERVSSRAWDTFTRLDVTREQSRGQYLDGSRYAQGGAFASPRLDWGALRLRLGGRIAWAWVDAPADEASSTQAVGRAWWAGVGHAGLEWRPRRDLTALLSVEQGFRPPNLDDLTARQLTGQGTQVENPNLEPERAQTLEVGLRLARSRGRLEVWLFKTWLEGLMERRDAACPPNDRVCQATRRATPVTLVNLDEPATIHGAEGALELRLPYQLKARATISWAWGEGPSPLAHEAGRRPLSRVPPLNGTSELRWASRETGLYLGGALRWADDQDRLSYGDTVDRRIPWGGTPGYWVVDLRGGLRLPGQLSLNLALVNLFDTAYRVHGSSVNGAARGLLLNLEM